MIATLFANLLKSCMFIAQVPTVCSRCEVDLEVPQYFVHAGVALCFEIDIVAYQGLGCKAMISFAILAARSLHTGFCDILGDTALFVPRQSARATSHRHCKCSWCL